MTGLFRRARREGNERGAVLVEIVLLLPVLLLLVLGIVDFGIVYRAQINQNQGVRDTARILARAEYSQAGCVTEGDSDCVAMELIPDYPEDPPDANPNNDVDVWVIAPVSPEAGKEVVVCAEKPADPIWKVTDWFLGDVTLKSKTTMRVEKNIDLGGGLYGEMDSVGNNPPDWCTND